MTSGAPLRFVDSHVHHWDLSAHPWYPAIQNAEAEEGTDAGLGKQVGGLHRDYLRPQYEQDAAGFAVDTIVHVSATTADRAYLDEARWLDDMAVRSGWPAGVVGSLDPGSSMTTIAADLSAQAESSLFRGARILYGLEPGSSRALDVFRLFAGTGWVFDLVARPGEVADYLPQVAACESTVFALEHAGWPDTPDPGHRAVWRAGLESLAALPNVHCKISGLAMTLQTVEAPALRPYVETCIDVFGVDRCLFGSNFPVDGLFGSFSDLLGSYIDITKGLAEGDVHKLFVSNAQRLYRV